jgi:hypothetical protein
MLGLLAAVVLAGCSGAEADPVRPQPSAPPGPALQGRLLVQTKDYTVWAVSQIAAAGTTTGTGTTTTTTRLAGAVGAAAVSPDGTTLAYVASSGLVFKDLATGAERQPKLAGSGTRVSGYRDCLHWSPDNHRLLFQADDGGLYVTTPDGRLTVVDRPKHATYTQTLTGRFRLVPVPAPSTPTLEVSSQVTCGAWLDANRLVFDRRVHDMPDDVIEPSPAGSPILAPADITTVAVLGAGTVQLVNSATRWTLDDTCGTHLLTRHSNADQDAFLVTNLATGTLTQTDAATPHNALVPHANGRAIATFMPGTCTLLVVDQWQNGEGTYDTHRLDLTTHNLTAGASLWGFMFFQPGGITWAPQPNPTAFADFSEGEEHLRLLDLATGGVTIVNLPEAQNPARLHALLAWLPG